MGFVESRTTWRVSPLLRPGPLLVAGWVAYVLGAETLGRSAANDFQDAIGVLAFYALVALTLWAHRRRRLRWLGGLLRRLRSGLSGLRRGLPVTGVDFRRTPALPRGFPRGFTRICLAGWCAALAAFALRGLLPGEVRALALQASPSLGFAFTGLFWAALAAGILLFVGVSLVLLHLFFRRLQPLRRLPSLPWVAGCAAIWWSLVLATALKTPAWTPLALLGAYLLLQTGAVMLPRHPSLLFQWRPSAAGPEAARVVEIQHWKLLEEWTVAGFAVTLFLLGAGTALASGDPGVTPVTAALGRALGWSLAGFCPFWAGLTFLLFRNGWAHNPAHPCPLRLHVSGVRDAACLAELRRALAGSGYRLRCSAGAPRRGEVALRIAGEAAADAPEATRWPLAVTPAALAAPELRRRIHRRDEIQRRRHLVRGLERAFKAVRGPYRRGVGFWLAPHLWFVEGMQRDEEEEGRLDFCYGPLFRSLLPLSARNHLYSVLAALEVDLIFVEDGVEFRKFRHVLRTLFEVFDVHAGCQRLEERHFCGLEGLHVMLHEYGSGRKLLDPAYPEPDYEDIGRARILHVFKDRGGEKEPVPEDVGLDFLPAPPSLLLVG